MGEGRGVGRDKEQDRSGVSKGYKKNVKSDYVGT